MQSDTSTPKKLFVRISEATTYLLCLSSSERCCFKNSQKFIKSVYCFPPSLVVWLPISMFSALSLNFWTNTNLSITFFIIFVSCAVCASQVMAVAVTLFPTSYRSMATSFIVMSGRIGSAAGSNAVGLLLKDHCTWIFYLAAGALICK